jgi:hypothetical protein
MQCHILRCNVAVAMAVAVVVSVSYHSSSSAALHRAALLLDYMHMLVLQTLQKSHIHACIIL